jgi:predicted Zn finger-like uncharacterized protein
MNSITNCPACQTQFIVTEDQLNQHNGKVRCGHCLHVFNARDELVELNIQTKANLTSVAEIDATEEAIAPVAEIINMHVASTLDADDIVNKSLIKDSQDSYFNDTDNKSTTKNFIPTWLIGLFSLVLLIMAITQSVYFLRTDIASYYPNTKTYLVQVCKKIGCRIDLPKKIDLIVIDDSDMQEDADHVGLIHLSSTLINQASFNQAYPNIELTLTDIEDTPKLRRIFKPNEYLPDHADIAKGLAAGEEVKVKLSITAQGGAVAGYRVFVSY